MKPLTSIEWWRLFVGDLSNDVNERTLDNAFNKYPSYCKCKVVRDRLSLKVSQS
jgi:RNA recognition motif-containing protein